MHTPSQGFVFDATISTPHYQAVVAWVVRHGGMSPTLSQQLPHPKQRAAAERRLADLLFHAARHDPAFKIELEFRAGQRTADGRLKPNLTDIFEQAADAVVREADDVHYLPNGQLNPAPFANTSVHLPPFEAARKTKPASSIPPSLKAHHHG